MQPVKEINLKTGDVLYEQGDSNDCAFVVASGEVIMYFTEDGTRHDCERRGPGSVLGSLSVLTKQPRYVSAQAVEDTIVFRISAEHILNDFDRVGPLLRTCVETSISFNARLKTAKTRAQVPAELIPSKVVPKTSAAVDHADAIIERYRFEIDILKGIEAGQFFMVYQPIVTMDTGATIGFEALMRWQHPERGFVPPDHFIPVAEDLGVIGALTDIALEQTCDTLHQLQQAIATDAPLFASINVSGHDIARVGFPEVLAHTLDRHHLWPHQVKLEVTETAILPNNPTVIENLAALQSLGCGISIDDFGTGYSNLSHLKTLPLSALKIDRAFAGDAHCNEVSGSIVAMLVGLGDSLGVDIVAEGVETAEDVKVLSGLGCTYAQGYYYHRPAPKEELMTLLSTQLKPSAASLSKSA